MRVILIAATLCTLPFAASAQSVPCDRSMPQTFLNQCAAEEWKRADDELNRLWGRLKPAADRAGWGDRLLSEQRARLRTRDARCEGQRDEYAGGSIAPLIYFDCMHEMTIRRNAEFRALM